MDEEDQWLQRVFMQLNIIMQLFARWYIILTDKSTLPYDGSFQCPDTHDIQRIDYEIWQSDRRRQTRSYLTGNLIAHVHVRILKWKVFCSNESCRSIPTSISTSNPTPKKELLISDSDFIELKETSPRNAFFVISLDSSVHDTSGLFIIRILDNWWWLSVFKLTVSYFILLFFFFWCCPAAQQICSLWRHTWRFTVHFCCHWTCLVSSRPDVFSFCTFSLLYTRY